MTPTDRALWEQLRAAGIVAADEPPAGTGTPWLVQLLLGGSAWFASLFMLGFFAAVFHGLWDSAPGLLVLGLCCCGAAAALMRAVRDHPFLGQLLLPVSLAGQMQVSAAFWMFADGPGPEVITGAAGMCLIGTAMAFAVPQALHRFLCSAGVLTGIGLVMYELDVIRYAAPLFAAASAAVWWYARAAGTPSLHAALRPVGYALAPALLFVASLSGDDPLMDLFMTPAPVPRAIWSATPEAIALLAVVVGTAIGLLHERGIAPASSTGVRVLVAAGIVAVALLPVPGALAALLLMVLAFSAAERTLLLLGGAGLLLYLGHYYYDLDLTLLQKSIALAASGGVLLVLRQAGRALHGASA